MFHGDVASREHMAARVYAQMSVGADLAQQEKMLINEKRTGDNVCFVSNFCMVLEKEEIQRASVA